MTHVWMPEMTSGSDFAARYTGPPVSAKAAAGTDSSSATVAMCAATRAQIRARLCPLGLLSLLVSLGSRDGMRARRRARVPDKGVHLPPRRPRTGHARGGANARKAVRDRRRASEAGWRVATPH